MDSNFKLKQFHKFWTLIDKIMNMRPDKKHDTHSRGLFDFVFWNMFLKKG